MERDTERTVNPMCPEKRMTRDEGWGLRRRFQQHSYFLIMHSCFWWELEKIATDSSLHQELVFISYSSNLGWLCNWLWPECGSNNDVPFLTLAPRSIAPLLSLLESCLCHMNKLGSACYRMIDDVEDRLLVPDNCPSPDTSWVTASSSQGREWAQER